jgi:hypothetical protein
MLCHRLRPEVKQGALLQGVPGVEALQSHI